MQHIYLKRALGIPTCEPTYCSRWKAVRASNVAASTVLIEAQR